MSTCPKGEYNTNWENDKRLNSCNPVLQCQVCPPGTYGDQLSAWHGCNLCGASSSYCDGGVRRVARGNRCTYRSELLGSPSQGSFTMLSSTFPGGQLTTEEARARDAVKKCGEVVLDATSVTVNVVKPAVAFFDIQVSNVGELPVQLSYSSATFPSWLKLENGPTYLAAGESSFVSFIVESSSIAERELTPPDAQDSSILGTLTKSFTFLSSQVFRNQHKPDATHSVSVALTLEAALLTVLPQETNLETLSLAPIEQTVTIYNMQPDDVAWNIVAVRYISDLLVTENHENDLSKLQATSQDDWITVSPSSGVLSPGFSCRDGKVVSSPDWNNEQEIQLHVNPLSLMPGVHVATIEIASGGTVLESKVRITVLPGPTHFSASTWSFVGDEFRLPNLVLDMTPRDVYGVPTRERPLESPMPAPTQNATTTASQDVNAKTSSLSDADTTTNTGNATVANGTLSVVNATVANGTLIVQGNDTSTVEIDDSGNSGSSSDDDDVPQFSSLTFQVRYTLLSTSHNYTVPENMTQFVDAWRTNLGLTSRTYFVEESSFTGKFELNMDLPSTGYYWIEVMSMDGAQHLLGSPVGVFVEPEQCLQDNNEVATEGTGKGCVCVAGHGILVDSSQSGCQPCSAGTYNPGGSVTCTECPLGTYQSNVGSPECAYCETGYEPNSLRTGCVQCGANEVVNLESPYRECRPCDVDQQVVGGMCMCQTNYYTDQDDGSCVVCPEGAFCAFGTIDTIVPLQGYWRTEWDPLLFVKCAKESFCLGVNPSDATRIARSIEDAYSNQQRDDLSSEEREQRRRLADANAAATQDMSQQTSVIEGILDQYNISVGCADGFTGAICRDCDLGFYPTTDGGCLQCDGKTRTLGLFTLAFFVSLGCLLYFIYRTIKSDSASRRREIMVSKIVISHLQLVSMASDFPLRWPVWVDMMFNVFTVVTSAGDSAFDTHCIAYHITDLTSKYMDVFFKSSMAYAVFPFAFALCSFLFWKYCVPRWYIFKHARSEKKKLARHLKDRRKYDKEMQKERERTNTPASNASVFNQPSTEPDSSDLTDLDIEQNEFASGGTFPPVSPRVGESSSPVHRPMSGSWGSIGQTEAHPQTTLDLDTLQVNNSTEPPPPTPKVTPLVVPNGRERFEKFIVSNIVFLFMVQPWLTRVGLQFFSCSRAIDDRSFLEASFSLQCWGAEHRSIVWLGYVILVFYGFGIPLLTLFTLYCVVLRTRCYCRSRKERANSMLSNTDDEDDVRGRVVDDDVADRLNKVNRLDKNRATFGFIYSGYRTDCFFWETVIMARKTAFAVIAVALKPVGVDIQTYSAMIVLVVAGVLQLVYLPYDSYINLNVMENASLTVSFATLMCGVFLYSDNSAEWFKIFCSLTVIVLNGLFLLCVLYAMRREVKSGVSAVAKEIHSTVSSAGRLTARFKRKDSTKLSPVPDNASRTDVSKMESGALFGQPNAGKRRKFHDDEDDDTDCELYGLPHAADSVRARGSTCTTLESPTEQPPRPRLSVDVEESTIPVDLEEGAVRQVSIGDVVEVDAAPTLPPRPAVQQPQVAQVKLSDVDVCPVGTASKGPVERSLSLSEVVEQYRKVAETQQDHGEGNRAAEIALQTVLELEACLTLDES